MMFPSTLCLAMLDEAGAETLLHTFAWEAVVEADCIRGIIIEYKAGRSVVLAKLVIDASGDEDAVYHAGVPYTKSREDDGKMQPVTIMFKAGGVEDQRAMFPDSFESLVETEKGEPQALAHQHRPILRSMCCCTKPPCLGWSLAT